MYKGKPASEESKIFRMPMSTTNKLLLAFFAFGVVAMGILYAQSDTDPKKAIAAFCGVGASIGCTLVFARHVVTTLHQKESV